MDGILAGWMGRWEDEWVSGWKGIERRMDVLITGWVEGLMDGPDIRMDNWVG
jgi:hypothetical protein